jgi:hypothetical protein
MSNSEHTSPSQKRGNSQFGTNFLSIPYYQEFLLQWAPVISQG